MNKVGFSHGAGARGRRAGRVQGPDLGCGAVGHRRVGVKSKGGVTALAVVAGKHCSRNTWASAMELNRSGRWAVPQGLERGLDLAVVEVGGASLATPLAVGSRAPTSGRPSVRHLDVVVVGGGVAEQMGQDLADRVVQGARAWMLQSLPDLRFVVSSLCYNHYLADAAARGGFRLTKG